MNNPLVALSFLLCVAGGLQGVFLVVALHRSFKDKNVDKQWLLWFLGLITITLLGRLMYLYPEAIDQRLPILTDLILYLYGPFYYFFVKSTFHNTSVGPMNAARTWIHFIPAILHLLLTVPIFLISIDQYITYLQGGRLFIYFVVIMVVAFAHNLYYWDKANRLMGALEKQFDGTRIRFSADYIYLIKWWYLSVIICFGLVIGWYFISFEVASLLYQLNWIAASWMTYALGYFVLRKPETFGDIVVDIKSQKALSDKEKKQIEQLASNLVFQLEEKRIFLDPEISLLSLAKALDTNNVLLSKTINQHFNMGFYDLINTYRVKEFIRLVQDPSTNHFTYFALSLQAGFNSKTSFNKYFKKVTKQTPKEYFRKLSVA